MAVRGDEFAALAHKSLAAQQYIKQRRVRRIEAALRYGAAAGLFATTVLTFGAFAACVAGFLDQRDALRLLGWAAVVLLGFGGFAVWWLYGRAGAGL
jgi:hypothetical protein